MFDVGKYRAERDDLACVQSSAGLVAGYVACGRVDWDGVYLAVRSKAVGLVGFLILRGTWLWGDLAL